MRGKLARCLVVGFVGWAPAAHAEAPPVSLALEECPNLSRPEVERIFSAELGSATTVEASPGVTDVTIVCDGPRVVVRVKDPLSRKTVQRSFDTSTFDARATPRLIALAASELVLASWAELYSNPLPSVEPEGSVPSPGETKAVLDVLKERKFVPEGDDKPHSRRAEQSDEPDERMLRVIALASGRWFPADPGSLFGAGIRVGEERFRFVGWALDSIIERGEVIGHAGSQRLSEKVTSLTFGASLLAYYRIQFLTLRLGTGLRAGVVASDQPTIAPWGWPLVTTVWTVRVERFAMDLSGEAGYVAFPISNGGTVSGYWVSGQLGFGMVL